MLEPDEVPKPWIDSAIRKSPKLPRESFGFAEGAASLILLGGIVAIDRFCERKNKHKPHESWEKRLQEAAPVNSIAPRER